MNFEQQGRSSAQTLAIAIAMTWAAKSSSGDISKTGETLAKLRQHLVDDVLKNATGGSALSEDQWAIVRRGFDAEFGKIVELVTAITSEP